MNEKDYIIESYNIDYLPLDHKKYLIDLKKTGFEPKVIYDIGSAVLHWTKFALLLWPNAKYFLFEANRDVFFTYDLFKKENPDLSIEFFNVMLSDYKTTKKYYKSKQSFGGNSYYLEQTHFFNENNYILLETDTLDNISRNIPKPDLCKIDTQGSEYDIINGAKNVLKNCEHLIVEMQHVDYNKNAPKVEITLPFIESLDFKCISKKFSNNIVDADYGFINTRFMKESDEIYDPT